MLKKQNGITLVALIITIIVMLILVGVTVNMALNGGIFDQGNDAATKTEKETIYEQVVMAMTLRDDGKINIDETYSKTKSALEEQGLKVSAMQGGMFTVEGKKGIYTYTITETQIIRETDNNASTYKFYGTEDMYVAFTPDNVWLKDNAGNFLDAGESLQLKTKTKKEFFDGEFFNNLSDEEKKNIQDGFTQMEQQYGEVTTLFFPYIEGDFSPYPQGFMTDGTKIYVMGERVLELEKNEELKKKLVKKKSGFSIFTQSGELKVITGSNLSDVELFAIVDETSKQFSFGFLLSGQMAPLVAGTTEITKNDKELEVIVEGAPTIIRSGADKVLVTVTAAGEEPNYTGGDKFICCYIQDDIIYMDDVTNSDKFDGQVNNGDELSKLTMVKDVSNIAGYGIYLED